jgi:uncharacterized protein YjbI with pentapeptide repeats
MYRTNLRSANLQGARMEGLTLCNTIMPDSTINDSGCAVK